MFMLIASTVPDSNASSVDELRLLEQSLVVSGTYARELWNMSKWIVTVYRFHVQQISLSKGLCKVLGMVIIIYFLMLKLYG